VSDDEEMAVSTEHETKRNTRVRKQTWIVPVLRLITTVDALNNRIHRVKMFRLSSHPKP
jgi:hypothetical protein